MPDPAAARAFLRSEVEALEPFDFLMVAPAGKPSHTVEVTRREDARLEVRIPGRPPTMAELPVAVRSALRERGFVSADASDRGQPWIRETPDAESAVALLRDALVEVFTEKDESALDIGHGSHKLEHEARTRLARARARIEAIVTEILGRRAEQDEDADYIIPSGDVRVVVAPRATSEAQIIVRVFSICNVGVRVTPDLGLFLARLNFGLMFGRFALDVEHSSIWFDETLLGEEFREEELRFAIRVVASTADEWDDRFKRMFGGFTYQEMLAGSAPEPPEKPGQGAGLYL